MQGSIGSNTSSGVPTLEFLVGRDAGGHWLVVETHGLAGGFFTSAADALRFVASDFDGRPSHVEMVGGVLEPFQQTCAAIADRYAGRRTARRSADAGGR